MTEFNQIEQKLAEYEMAKDDADRISFDEKSEQIKRNLKAQLILEFVKIDEAIFLAPNDGSIDKWDAAEKLDSIFTEQVDPIFNFSGLSQAIRRNEFISKFFWPEQGPLVDRLTPETIEQCMKLADRNQSSAVLKQFNSYILFPPIADNEIDGMIESIRRQYNFTFKIEAEMSKIPRPDFIYPLAFPDLDIYGQMIVDGQSIKQIIERTMPNLHINGLNFQEYLFWLVCLSKIASADKDSFLVNKIPKVLFDERKDEGGMAEVGRIIKMNDRFATFNTIATQVRDEEVLVALNGWEERNEQ